MLCALAHRLQAKTVDGRMLDDVYRDKADVVYTVLPNFSVSVSPPSFFSLGVQATRSMP